MLPQSRVELDVLQVEDLVGVEASGGDLDDAPIGSLSALQGESGHVQSGAEAGGDDIAHAADGSATFPQSADAAVLCAVTAAIAFVLIVVAAERMEERRFILRLQGDADDDDIRGQQSR